MQLVPSSAKRPLGRAPVEVYERLAQHDSMSVTGITNTVAAAAALDDTMIPVVSVPEMVDGFSAMDEAGVLPEVSLSAWTRAIDMRPEEYPPVRWPASFRDAEAHLLRQCVHQHPMNRNDVDLETGLVGVPSVVFYHGTILAAAHGIAKAGGFLPGENGHTKGKRHYKGCFGSTYMDTAYYRGDPTRYLEADGVYSLASCPVILELEASCLHIVRYNRRVNHCVCVPGLQGQVLGCDCGPFAIWVNAALAHNYISLTYQPALRKVVTDSGGIVKACCGGGRQMLDFPSCGRIVRSPRCSNPEFMPASAVVGQKVGQYLMCKRCAPQWIW